MSLPQAVDGAADLASLAEIRRWTANGRARTIRTEHHLSCAEIAAAVDVDESTIWRWENGKRSPHGPAAVRYHAILTELDR